VRHDRVRLLAEQPEDDRQVVRGEAPENVFLGAEAAEVSKWLASTVT
jgi:hypothetical protein